MQSQLQLPTKEEILTTWSNVSIRDNKLIPKVSGVYVLVISKEFVYIGTAKSLHRRLSSSINDHPISWYLVPSNFRRFKEIREYLHCKYSLRLHFWTFNSSENKARYRLETQLIRTFKPPLNQAFSRIEFIDNLFNIVV